MNVHSLYAAISPRLRRSRMERLARELALTPTTRVLDVGGSPAIWQVSPVQPDLTYLNLAAVPDVPADRMVVQDACDLPFADNSFDLVFSSSMIEHLRTPERQAAFAREAVRVGRRVWVQTPDRWFPFETHLLTVCGHWLPRSWHKRVLPWISGRQLFRDDTESVDDILRTLHLISRRELAALFPDADLIAERCCGLPKSLIAVR